MNTYKYRVEQIVTVNAPDPNDAEELLHDYFGPGAEGEDIDVSSVTIEPIV